MQTTHTETGRPDGTEVFRLEDVRTAGATAAEASCFDSCASRF